MTPPLPRNPFEVLQYLNYDEPVSDDDPRFVDLDAARGNAEGLTQRLATKFQYDLDNNVLYPAKHRHVLLFGPIGSGKSTELRRFAHTIRQSGRLFPVLLNVRGEVDINNLQYADMLMALATALVRELENFRVDLADTALGPLKDWFREQVETHDTTKELVAEIKSEATLEGGLPFFVKFLSRITARFKNSSAYKESLRDVVQKSFSQFASAFNTLVLEAEAALTKKGLGERILLIVDGTDKIPAENAERLFIGDTEQLLAIRAYVLYTAPITLKYLGASHGKLDADEVLPIVKLHHRDETRHEEGWRALRELLKRRVDTAVFTDEALIDDFVAASGGHPRELLRLLRTACEIARSKPIDAGILDRAMDKLAADFRYWLQPEDYKLLAEVDAANGEHVGNDERTRNLLWRLALLHYNDGAWRRSHPLVRRLEGYQRAMQAIRDQASSGKPA